MSICISVTINAVWACTLNFKCTGVIKLYCVAIHAGACHFLAVSDGINYNKIMNEITATSSMIMKMKGVSRDGGTKCTQQVYNIIIRK